LAFLEFLVTGAIIAIILFLFFFGIGGFWEKFESLALFNPAFIFIPYGVALFSLSGRVAIPSVVNYFQEKKENPEKSKLPIIVGAVIPVAAYLLFVFGVIGLSGEVSGDSVSGLIGMVPKFVLYLLGALGLFSLWSTYIMLSDEVKKSFESDLGFPKFFSVAAVLLVPIILYFSGLNNLLGLIEIIGGVFIGLEGILIVLMWLKVFRRKSLLAYLLLLIFAVGIVYALIY
jgi:hypothetical protein